MNNTKVLKFRIWNPTEKKFYFPTVLSIDLLNNTILFPVNGKEMIVDDLKNLSEYIGLNDANGKEIYSNDLVNFYTPAYTHGPDREDYIDELVGYDAESAGFLFGMFYYDGWCGFRTDEIKDIKVVGNVFES